MRTLIVDDSNFIREYTKQLLQKMGAVCTEAGNGVDALAVLMTDGKFELMLIDLNMPKMNGLECLKRLKETGLCEPMKIMMVTTEADHHFINEALEYGADEFLMKPFTPQSLKEKLLLLGFEAAS
ncbi:response regulator [Granulicella tundricola]|uniref:Response regulator receiver protein n=1 Tax=Granulicella tundricola (strain ATCC BAA-1859 / DSM 23138 / MP5ACTX9) TaxID=1198114 RepID=E8X304_GRATM|nr:response regulator [Granulicella tundricola]ADW68138.1 response regulator receiver protein [Granulicella tundricola MP5ACTX9]